MKKLVISDKEQIHTLNIELDASALSFPLFLLDIAGVLRNAGYQVRFQGYKFVDINDTELSAVEGDNPSI